MSVLFINVDELVQRGNHNYFHAWIENPDDVHTSLRRVTGYGDTVEEAFEYVEEEIHHEVSCWSIDEPIVLSGIELNPHYVSKTPEPPAPVITTTRKVIWANITLDEKLYTFQYDVLEGVVFRVWCKIKCKWSSGFLYNK